MASWRLLRSLDDGASAVHLVEFVSPCIPGFPVRPLAALSKRFPTEGLVKSRKGMAGAKKMQAGFVLRDGWDVSGYPAGSGWQNGIATGA